MDDFFVNHFTNVGFPAAMCFYFMFSMNKTLQKLISSVDSLTTEIKKSLEVKSVCS